MVARGTCLLILSVLSSGLALTPLSLSSLALPHLASASSLARTYAPLPASGSEKLFDPLVTRFHDRKLSPLVLASAKG